MNTDDDMCRMAIEIGNRLLGLLLTPRYKLTDLSWPNQDRVSLKDPGLSCDRHQRVELKMRAGSLIHLKPSTSSEGARDKLQGYHSREKASDISVLVMR